MFMKKGVFVFVIIATLALTAVGQKTKATPTPAPRASDTDKSMEKAATEFKKTLNNLVKMLDSGFKDIRGEEKPRNSGDSVRRFKTSTMLLQTEACEISILEVTNSARYAAYYPQVPTPGSKKLYDKLLAAVTEALGPSYTQIHLEDEFSDDPEVKVAFYPKGSSKYVVTVAYMSSQSRFDPIKTDVILTVGYGLF